MSDVNYSGPKPIVLAVAYPGEWSMYYKMRTWCDKNCSVWFSADAFEPTDHRHMYLTFRIQDKAEQAVFKLTWADYLV